MKKLQRAKMVTPVDIEGKNYDFLVLINRDSRLRKAAR